MIIVKVVAQTKQKELEIKCPECQHLNSTYPLVEATKGQIICWCCKAILEWKEERMDNGR